MIEIKLRPNGDAELEINGLLEMVDEAEIIWRHAKEQAGWIEEPMYS